MDGTLDLFCCAYSLYSCLQIKSKLKTREKLKEAMTGELMTLKVNLQGFSSIIKELGNKVNAALRATLFKFIIKYGFEISCNGPGF